MEDRIECVPGVMLGKPVIVGTRITVEFILEALAAGEPIDQLVHEYPVLERDDVLAALVNSSGIPRGHDSRDVDARGPLDSPQRE